MQNQFFRLIQTLFYFFNLIHSRFIPLSAHFIRNVFFVKNAHSINFIRWGLAGIIALVALGLGFQPVAASPANQSAVATLEPLQGLVEHLPNGTSQWQTVNNLIQVGQGDQIRTDASGWALLTFFTGASTEIFAETQVSLEVLQTPDSEGVFQVNLRQLAGSTINSVSSILDNRSQFDVTTPNITATVRGTNFAIRLTEPNLTTISVREGQVETQSSDPNAEPILLEAGQSLTYTADEAGEILNELDYPTPPPAPQSQQPSTSPPAQTLPVASGGFTPVGDALLCGGQPVSIPGR